MALSVTQLQGNIEITGAEQAKTVLKGVGVAADKLGQTLSTIKPFDAGKTITNEDRARAKLRLIELDVEKARETLASLENAADADKSVANIDSARAKLTLLEAQAQDAQRELDWLAIQGQRAGDDLAEMGRDADHSSSLLSKLANTGRSAFSRLAEAGRSAFTTLANTGRSAIATLTSGFASLPGRIMSTLSVIGLASDGIRSIADAATGVARALFVQNTRMEQAEISFLAFLNSAEAVNTVMAELRQFAAETPFKFPEIQSATLKLLNMGVATQDLTKYLNNVGNGVAKVGGGGQTLNEVLTILNQMTMKGQIYAEEMQQLAERNIPAYKLLADAMGLTTAELQDMMQKGELGADKVTLLVEAMGEFGNGAMQMQAKTMAGLLSQVEDNALLAWASFTGPMFEKAKGSIENLAQLVGSERFQQFAVVMGERVGGALDRVSSFMDANVLPVFRDFWTVLNSEPMAVLVTSLENLGVSLGKVWESASPVVNIFDALDDKTNELSGPADVLANTLYNLGAIIDTYVVPIANKLSDFLDQTLPPALGVAEDGFAGMRDIADKLKQPLSDLIDTLSPLVSGFLDWVDKSDLVKNSLSLLGDVLKTILDGVNNLVDGASGLVKFFQDNEAASIGLTIALGALAGGLAAVAISGIASLLPFLPHLAIGLMLIAGKAWIAAAGIWAMAGPFILIGAVIGAVIAGIILAVTHWGEISAFVSEKWGQFSSWFMDMMGRVGSFFKEKIDAVVTWGQEWGDRVRSFFEGVGNKVREIWEPIWQWVYDHIVSKIQGAYDRVMSILSPIITFFSSLLTTLFQIAVALLTRIRDFFGQKFEEARQVVLTVLDGMRASIVNTWTNIWNKTVEIFNNVKKWIEDRWNEIKTFIDNVTRPIRESIANTWNTIWTNVTDWWNRIYKAISDKVTVIKDAVLKPFNQAKDAIGNVTKGIANGIIDQLNNAIKGVNSFLTGIKNGINGIAEKLGVTARVVFDGIPLLPRYEHGTPGHPGGPALVGDGGPNGAPRPELAMINGQPMLLGVNGPMIVDLPRGSSVLPFAQTQALLRGFPGLSGRIPAYLEGIGEAWNDFWTWAGSGAKTILDNVLNAMGISGFTLPPLFLELPGAIFGKLKDWAVEAITKWLPKIDWSGGGASNVQISGDLQSWISQAIAATGVPGWWASYLGTIAMHESGGNPRAINDWDINAQNGDPSRGVMQTISATFNAYKLAGMNDIWNPVHNIAAAIRYIQARYGNVRNVPGIMSLARGGNYVGYADGGLITEPIVGRGLRTGTNYTFGERGYELVTPLGAGGSRQAIHVHVHVHAQSDTIVDGYRFAGVLMPHIVNQIRYNVGTYNM